MTRRNTQIPNLIKHRSGQARACFSGRDLYFGRFGTPEAQEKFDRTVAAWLSNGRRLPDPALTVAGLAQHHEAHVRSYYVKRGQPTHTARIAAWAMQLFMASGLAEMRADRIDGSHIKHFQRYLAADEHRRWCRKTINQYVDPRAARSARGSPPRENRPAGAN